MLKFQRRIRDNLHGSVAITEIEDRVISHSSMQRLRYIRQLGFFHLVFPGATHGRFEHSLGVMEVATRCFHALRENQLRLKSRLQAPLPAALKPTFQLATALLNHHYALQVLRLAALLHDIGHNPFSHCAEHLLPSGRDVLKAHSDLPAYLTKAIAAMDTPPCHLSERITNFRRGGCHEVFTLLLAHGVLEDVLTPQHTMVQDVLALLARAIPWHPSSPLQDAQLKGGEILKELISGDLDADRMDYLLRDSQQAGVRYGIFDSERLQDSLLVIYRSDEERFQLALHEGGLAAFEGFFAARRSMFRQLYFHKTSVASEAMMQHISRNLGGWCFPLHREEYAGILDQDLQGILNARIEQSDLNEAQKEKLQRITLGLFRTRKLWKRTYEHTATHSDELLENPELQRVCRELRERDLAYEITLSTHFLSHSHSRHSLDDFPVVRMDAQGHATVHTLAQMQENAPWLRSRAIYMVRVYSESAVPVLTSASLGP